MFQTNSFCRFYQCPKWQKKGRCSRAYCQYNHGDQSKADHFVIDYRQSSTFGFDDFFSNLKPEDIQDIVPGGFTQKPSLHAQSTDSITSNQTSDQPENKTTNNAYQTNDQIKQQLESKNSEEYKQLESENSDEGKQSNKISELHSQQNNSEMIQENSSSEKNIDTNLSIKRKTEENDDISDLCKKNVRIAHTPNYDISKKPKLILKKSCRQVMLERWKILENQKKPTKESDSDNSLKSEKPNQLTNYHPINTNSYGSFLIQSISNSSSSLPVLQPTPTQSIKLHNLPNTDNELVEKIAHVPQVKKSELVEKIAHVPQVKKPELPSTKSISLLPANVSSTKIPMKLRKDYLNWIYKELENANDSAQKSNLADEAEKIEKDICLRSKNIKIVYQSLLASKIHSIRSMGEKHETSGKYSPTIVASIPDNYSIIKRKKVTYNDLSIERMVPLLEKMIIPKKLLQKYGFPIYNQDTGFPMLRDDKPNMKFIQYDENVQFTCERCSITFQNPQTPKGRNCVYHPGHIFNYKVFGNFEREYSCCRANSDSVGCNSWDFHVTNGYNLLEFRQGFVKTVPSSGQPPKIYALDCEMCYTEALFELGRITILDFTGKVIYDSLVKPKFKIIDYNTKYSGLKESDFENVHTTLEDVQKKLLELVNEESYIVGHGLDSDFKVLKLYHERVIDTTYLYPHRKGLPFKRSLKTLAAEYLFRLIQDKLNDGHDSGEDALAALDLAKIQLQKLICKIDWSQ